MAVKFENLTIESGEVS